MSKVEKLILSPVYGDETGTANVLAIPHDWKLHRLVTSLRGESRRLGNKFAGSASIHLDFPLPPPVVIFDTDDDRLPEDFQDAASSAVQSCHYSGDIRAFEHAVAGLRSLPDRSRDSTPVEIEGVEIVVREVSGVSWSVYLRFCLRHGEVTLGSDNLSHLFE